MQSPIEDNRDLTNVPTDKIAGWRQWAESRIPHLEAERADLLADCERIAAQLASTQADLEAIELEMQRRDNSPNGQADAEPSSDCEPL